MFEFSVSGVEDVNEILNQIAPKNARKLMRTTVHAVTAQVTKKAKSNVGAVSRTGTLKRAIKTKRERSPPNNPSSTVFITHGDSAKHDAFYWLFVEHGTRGEGGINAVNFVKKASLEVRSNIQNIFRDQFTIKLEKLIERELARGRTV